MFFDLPLLSYFAIFFLIAFSGFIDSIAGGGGLISVPTYLLFGVPPEFILGTNKTVSTTGGTLALWRYIKAGLINWPIMASAVVMSLIGSFLGAQYSKHLSEKHMLIMLLVITPFILFISQFKKASSENIDLSFSMGLAVKAALIGFCIGSYDGFFGPGTGSFFIVALVWVLGMNLQGASANARLLNYSSNLSAFVAFLMAGRILWSVALIAILGSLLGNFMGSKLMLEKSDKIIKPVFNLVLILLMAKCLYDLVQMTI